jgi:hypothetical protein
VTSELRVIAGDRIRLVRPHGAMTVGDEGVVAAFSRCEMGDLIIAHFDGRNETIPEASLVLATSLAPRRLQVSLPSTLE